jgi:hypothetical protein
LYVHFVSSPSASFSSVRLPSASYSQVVEWPRASVCFDRPVGGVVFDGGFLFDRRPFGADHFERLRVFVELLEGRGAVGLGDRRRLVTARFAVFPFPHAFHRVGLFDHPMGAVVFGFRHPAPAIGQFGQLVRAVVFEFPPRFGFTGRVTEVRLPDS